MVMSRSKTEIGSVAFVPELVAVDRADDKRTFKCFIESWEEEAKFVRTHPAEAKFLNKYGGIEFFDPLVPKSLGCGEHV